MAGSLKRHIGNALRGLFVAVLLVVAPGAPGHAQSELIAAVDLTEDPSGTLAVEQVVGADFRPITQTLARGYTSATQWLRVRILPAPDGGEVVLVVRPPILDDVRLFGQSPKQGGNRADPAHSGRYHELDANWPSSLRGFSITPPEGGADYYLRIASTGSIAIDITARTTENAMRISLVTDLVQICYFSFMLVLMLWSLRMLLLAKEPMFWRFAAMQAVWVVHNIVSFGYAEILLPSVEREKIILFFRAMVIIAAILSIGFHRTVLTRYRPADWAVRLLDLQLGVMLVAFALFLWVDLGLALRLNAFAITATPFIFLLNALTAREEASPGLATMRVIYGLLSAALLLWILALLGLSQITVVSLYGFMIHGVATGILMFAILHLHARNLIAASQVAKATIIKIEHRRAIEREHTRMLAQFIDMLTHEARNAFAVINMSISSRTISDRQRGRVSDAITGLTDLIDRCNQTIRLDANGQTIERQTCDLVETLGRLCNGNPEAGRIDFVAEQPCVVQSDPVLLGVVFGNMLDNAMKYSRTGSRVTVRLYPDRGGITALFDNEQGNAGMPDPDQVFGKYYRHQRAQAQIGSGLGLYIVRGLVRLLGGWVAYQPTESRVRFRIWLPC